MKPVGAVKHRSLHWQTDTTLLLLQWCGVLAVVLSDRFTVHFGELTASLMLARRLLLVRCCVDASRESLANSAFSEANSAFSEAASWSFAKTNQMCSKCFLSFNFLNSSQLSPARLLSSAGSPPHLISSRGRLGVSGACAWAKPAFPPEIRSTEQRNQVSV